MVRRLFVTGGAGFIGSAVVRTVIAETDWEVMNLDRLSYASVPDALAPVEGHPRYRFVRGDIRDPDLLDRMLGEFRPDIIMHLAAESHVDRSIDDPRTFVDTNVVGTSTLLTAARAYWRTLPEPERSRFRFHHVSTDEVYGSLDGTGAFTEASPYRPNSPYSASKAASDHLVRAWHHTYGLPTVTSNCSNNFGPYQFPEKLIPLVILNALEGKRLPVYGDGGNVRDWLYVDDHVQGLLRVATQGRVGETYNIGGAGERRNIDVVRGICALLNELYPDSPHAPHDRLIAFVTDRPGHDARYAIDAGKITTELGWRPRESFETGLAKTVRWYCDHRDWWGALRAGGHGVERLGLARP